MRSLGRRVEAAPGLRWPAPGEIARAEELARSIRYRHAKGVVRYRSHDDAEADMREIRADAMARRSLALAGRQG